MADLRRHNGFTLVEIGIAVFILSAALVTLLGLQSAILNRTLRDEEKQQAMLVARTIISAIEIKPADLEVQDNTSTVEQLLDKLQVNVQDRDNEEAIEKFHFMARLKVENVGLKDIGDNLLKSISLTIYSKDAQNLNLEDAFYISYLIPIEDPGSI